jgi:hypothetical protein
MDRQKQAYKQMDREMATAFHTNICTIPKFNHMNKIKQGHLVKNKEPINDNK